MTSPHHDLTRRQAVGLAGALGAGALLSKVTGPGRLLDAIGLDERAQAATTTCVLTPSKTEGPYFVDEKLNRSDITSGAGDGVPLTLNLVAVRADGECAPVPGAVVDVWHANASGDYSDVGSQSGKTFLRGYQTTDDNGAVVFKTLYPGWYSGRAIHIHFKVRLYDGSSKTFEFTSQLFFDPSVTSQVVQSSAYRAHGSPDTPNSRDNIYGSDGDKLIVPLTGDADSGYTGTFVIGLSGLPSTTATTSAVDAALTSVSFRRTSGRRVARVTVKAGETVAVTARLTRSGRTLAVKRVASLAVGTRTIALRIPSGAAGGRAHLSLTLTDSSGATKTVSRTVTVPRRSV